MNDEDYKSEKFRQEYRNKLNEAIKKNGTFPKTADELENHVFNKAQNKTSYLDFIGQLINYIYKNGNKNLQNQQQMQNQKIISMANSQIQSNPIVNQNINQISIQQIQNHPKNMQPINQSDPMSALQNLASSQSTDTTNQPIVEQTSGMNQMNIMNQVPVQQMIKQNPQMNQMQQQNQPVIQQRVPLNQNRMIVNQMGIQGANQVSRTGQMINQNASIVPRMRQSNPNMIQQNSEFFQGQQVKPNQQPQPGMMQQQTLPPQQIQQQAVPQQQQFKNISSQQYQNNVSIVQNQNSTTINQMQHQIPLSNSMQAVPSPGNYVPSPSNIMSSPMNVNMMGQRGPPSVSSISSPNPTLNTPVMPSNSSPNIKQISDEFLYKEKLKQLSRFIEPLKRLIVELESGNANSKESSKIKSFLEIISDPNKRCSIDVLLKCEQVLERMDLRLNSHTPQQHIQQQVSSQANLTLASQKIESNICQPLYDTLKNYVRKTYFNHTLQRTFGPAVAAITNNTNEFFDVSDQQKDEIDEEEIPHVIQGEIAKLNDKFYVELDPLQHSKSKTLYLICRLDDIDLPCVPSILIKVSWDYPSTPPQCLINSEDYSSTKFLSDIYKIFNENLDKLPFMYSITTLLNRWEMSIRQALNYEGIFLS